MEYFTNESTGLITVSLGGRVITNCSADVDCPGRALCSINATWTSYQSMCICYPIYDATGASCESTGGYGIFFVVFSLLACLIATFGLMIVVKHMYLMVKHRVFGNDVVSTSLVFSFCSLSCIAIQTSGGIRYVFEDFPVDPLTGTKLIDSLLVDPIAVAGTFIFSILCMLNISLAWLEIAESAAKLSVRGTVRLSIKTETVRRSLIFIYTMTMIVIIAMLFIGRYDIAGVTSLPAMLILILSYVMAFRRMNLLLSEYASSQGLNTEGIAGSNGKSAVHKIRESLHTIRFASVLVSVSVFGYIIFLGAWVLYGGFADRPGKGFSLISVSLAWFCCSIGNLAVALYLRIVVRRKVQSRAPSQGKARPLQLVRIEAEAIMPRSEANMSQFATALGPSPTFHHLSPKIVGPHDEGGLVNTQDTNT